jgi:tRNA1(Val) A37 N6-methylase TrmN6
MNKNYKYDNLLLKNIYTKKNITEFYKKLKDNHKLIIYINNAKISRYYGIYKNFINNLCIGYDEDLQNYTNITDYYVDDVRFECYRLGFKNPIDAFYNDNNFKEKYDEIIQKYSIKTINKKINQIIMRKVLSKYKCCDLHPIDNLLNILKIFKPTKILDMCAGWGDRLFAALLYGKADYIGVDPNSKLKSRYKQIINDFGNNEHIYKVITEPFEKCDLSEYIINDELFDIMLSSPPYYICEQYSKECTQSLNYKTINNWFINFMYPSIDKIYVVLKDNGYMLMIINDVDIIINNKKIRINIVDKIIDYAIKKKFRLMTILKVDIRNCIQPLLVFIKNK